MSQAITFRERCLNFSAEITQLCESLPQTTAGKHIAGQMLRSGTSIGANVHEARGAESRADFIHKMQVSLKETRETYFWLGIIDKTKLETNQPLPRLIKECDELAAILARSVMTAQKNSKKNG